jgi:AraC-like DNA-binding protein
VAKVQIEHAKELLRSGRTVSDTATTLGFSACSNFSYAFRRAVGIPPKEFCKKADARAAQHRRAGLGVSSQGGSLSP